MLQTIEVHWIAFALALVIGLLVAWWLFGRGSRDTRDRMSGPDVLDEGAAPAQRNQALIDAPSAVTAASYADTGPPIFGGIGEVIAAAATSELADAVSPAPPAAQSVPAPVPPPGIDPSTEADDLRRIKGVGPKLVALLHGLGITSYAQIAAWDDSEIDRIDAKLGTFAGRIRRDSWVEQARFLAAQDTSGFEARFGKL